MQLVQEQVAMSQAEQQQAEMKEGRKPLEQLCQMLQRKVQLWLLRPPLQPSFLPESGSNLVVHTLVDADYRTATLGKLNVKTGLETGADDGYMLHVDGTACKSQAQTLMHDYNTCSLCKEDMLVSPCGEAAC